MLSVHKPWVLVVGEPFCAERTQWDDGRFEFRYFSGNHMLQLCLGSPSQREIDGFLTGTMHVGLYIEKNVIFFLFRIADCMAWSDQAISIRLVAESDQDLPPLPDGLRTLLNLVLVDSDTGIVVAMRMVTLGPHTSRLLHAAMRRQKDTDFNPATHQATIKAVYRRFPNSKALVKAAAVIERAGAKIP